MPLKRIDILRKIAYIAAQTPELTAAVDDPNYEWTVSESTVQNSWTRHEGIKLVQSEQRQVLAMIAYGSFENAATTKDRSEQLAKAARRIIENEGMSHVTEGGKLLPLAKIMMDATGCSVDTAKRHLAKQLHVMRGELAAIDGRGGKREGAGRPKQD